MIMKIFLCIKENMVYMSNIKVWILATQSADPEKVSIQDVSELIKKKKKGNSWQNWFYCCMNTYG